MGRAECPPNVSECSLNVSECSQGEAAAAAAKLAENTQRAEALEGEGRAFQNPFGGADEQDQRKESFARRNARRRATEVIEIVSHTSL
jgi:hypothetical protein